jgi:hypothetical protein
LLHVFFLCCSITTGQFYTRAKLNFRNLPESVQKDIKRKDEESSVPAKQAAPQAAPADQKSGRRKSIIGQIHQFNYSSFVRKYMPYVCIWICRLCSIVIAYAYDGFGGLAVLTWLLLSFIVNLEYFAKYSGKAYLPVFFIAFVYEYFINIKHLFSEMPGIFESIPRQKVYTGGQIIDTPIQPVEICGFVTNIVFMIVLTKYQKDLSLNRNEIS